MEKNLISVIMGSQSDWKTMRFACDVLEDFKIKYEKKIISAHRTPDRLFNYARNANQFSKSVFGGGGHKNAAGAISKKTLNKTINYFLESLKDYNEQLIK